MQSQYDYALDHLSVQAKQMDTGNDKDNSDYDLRSSLVNLLNSMIVLGAFYGFYLYFEPLAKSDLGGSQQEKMKFEIKKAFEVE